MQLTSSDDAFKAYHLAEVHAPQRPRVDVMIAKAASKTDVELLLTDVILEWVAQQLNEASQRGVKGGEEVVGLVQEARRELAIEGSHLVNVDD